MTTNTPSALLQQAMSGNAPPGAAPAASGQAGDFDFLSGEWVIHQRRLVDGAWDSFDGEATVRTILGGIVSVEELRIPARGFSGMGLRVLDLERGLWADYWLNAKAGTLGAATWGGFADGVGNWDSTEYDGDMPVIVRGVWDQITPDSCRWHQACSRDQGQTWEQNWVMHWRRA